jgi:hypothetical protein
MTRIACLKQLRARLPVRVPRRERSACSRCDTNGTVSSRPVNVAVYVTLRVDGEQIARQIVCAWAARNCLQGGPDRWAPGAGSTPAWLRIFHTVPAASR